MRLSKLTHIVGVLRNQIGLTQKEFGERVGIRRLTVQAIELEKRVLSRSIAEKISTVFDVDLDSLLLNDLSRGLRDRKGMPWTNKTREKADKKIKRWGNLAPQALMARLSTTQTLLGQYLTMKDFFAKGEPVNPHLAHTQWCLLFWLASGALRKLQDCQDYHQKEFPSIKTIIDDIRAVEANVVISERETRRIERLKEGKEDHIRRFFAERYGWDEQGLAAVELAQELGFEKALRLTQAEFSAMLDDRLRKKGLRPLTPEFEIADMVAAINDFYRDFQARTAPLPPSPGNVHPADDHKPA